MTIFDSPVSLYVRLDSAMQERTGFPSGDIAPMLSDESRQYWAIIAQLRQLDPNFGDDIDDFESKFVQMVARRCERLLEEKSDGESGHVVLARLRRADAVKKRLRETTKAYNRLRLAKVMDSAVFSPVPQDLIELIAQNVPEYTKKPSDGHTLEPDPPPAKRLRPAATPST